MFDDKFSLKMQLQSSIEQAETIIRENRKTLYRLTKKKPRKKDRLFIEVLANTFFNKILLDELEEESV